MYNKMTGLKQKKVDSSTLQGKSLPNGAWVKCLTVDCKQLLLDFIKEVKDNRKGNLPGLFLYSLL